MGKPPKEQILVIDDDEGSRNALTNLLRDDGYGVVAFEGAAEALDHLRRSRPHPQLIVLDLMMPGTDGWDFRQQQKRDPELARIPVIGVSAVGKLVDVEASFRKPLDYDEFLRTVERYVPQRPRRQKGSARRA